MCRTESALPLNQIFGIRICGYTGIIGGPGIHKIRVAEDEWGFTDSFINPVNLDADYIPEFFIHQGGDVNRREYPIGAGTYLLQYDKSQQKWVLGKFGGVRAFLFIGSGIWKVQVAALTVMLLLTVLLLQSRERWKGTMTEASILAAIILALSFFIPEMLAVFMFFLPVYPVARLIGTLRKRPFQEMQ